jgi:beta-galactosidase
MPALPSDRIFFGADYNPEQWPESLWVEDMRLMREAGVNLVSIGIFSWSKLQSAPGRFHFEWLDRLMDLLAHHGIGADLATATASPPHWLVKLHPDILPTLANGSRLSQGARQHYNPSSSAYLAAASEMVMSLATRYKNHPALTMWHISNEYACHVPADYGDETASAFRRWLKERYASLDELNEAWGTAFWSQHYYSWEEILPPRSAPTFQNPGQTLDFTRFSSDALLACCRAEARILRSITPDIPVTTNFMDWFKACDYAAWAREIDFTCLDTYPEPHHPPTAGALSADMTRSFGRGAPWLVMEQVTTHVNWRSRNTTKRPGLMRLRSYQSLARGADGICFFQWRQSRAGAEKFHGAMVGHGDPRNQRSFQECRHLGNELSRLREICGARVKARVAVFFDHANWWALELPAKPNNDLKYARPVEDLYQAVYRRNHAIDFVFADSDLSQYRVLLVPALYLVAPGVAEKLESFVHAGGTAIFTYFSGIVDQYDRVQLGGYPAPFRRLLGLEVEEWAVPGDDTVINRVVATPNGDALGLAGGYDSTFWAEVLRSEGCEVLATFVDDFFSGSPAVTRNAYGEGFGYYIATQFQPKFYDDLIQRILSDARLVPPLHAPEGVEICERHDRQGMRYTFILNHTDAAVEVADHSLSGFELLTETEVAGTIGLSPLGVAIVRRSPVPTDLGDPESCLQQPA